ncbi:MAG: hypothetical protein OES24_15790 [Acidimicrobiia bacterium]|nr:hypothetical protein [Acidimicrobiia bacterium]
MAARSALDREGQLPPPLRSRLGRRVATPPEAVAHVPDGATVYVTGLMGTPTTLVSALADGFAAWRNVTTTSDYLLEPLATFDRPDGVDLEVWPFHHVTVQPSRATGRLAADRLRIVPAHSSQFYRLFHPGGHLAVDVALVQVSEPGPDGRFSLGVSGGAALEVICRAELVIAEVNPAMPWIGGPAAFDRDAFDVLVEVEHRLLTLPGPVSSSPVDDVPARIGAHVAAEVANGSTIEYGIGAIPDAAVEALAGHEALGLHSGLLGDAAMALIDAGVLDGSAKSVDASLHVASAVLGTERVVDWVRERDDVVIVASNYSHGVPTLSRQQRFVAINSAIEVSLDGSVNAEQVGDRIVSGPGGQPDFAAGAALSVEGRSIVALPSTARPSRRDADGAPTSRIVNRLSAGVPVTVPRYLADRVVTEHGVARLRGVDGRQRAERLLAVADPDHGPAPRNL